MKIDRPVRTISGPGAGVSIACRLQPSSAGSSRAEPTSTWSVAGSSPLRTVSPPASAPSASIAAATVAFATSSGVIARASTSVTACSRWRRLPARRSRPTAAARPSFAWRSLPEITPAPTDAASQTNMDNWDPRSKSVTSGTNTRPPTRLTSAPASGPQTIAAATEMSAPRPPGTPSKLPGRTSAKSRSTATCARTKPGIHRGFQIQRASGPGLRARRAVRSTDRSLWPTDVTRPRRSRTRPRCGPS